MAPISPRSGTRATIRGGTDVVPAENEMSARASASSRTSTSSRPSTCARLKYRMRFTRRSQRLHPGLVAGTDAADSIDTDPHDQPRLGGSARINIYAEEPPGRTDAVGQPYLIRTP